MRTSSVLFLCCILFVLVGCSQHTTPPPSSGNNAKSAPPVVDPAQAATITGVVTFSGTPPAPVKIDMGLDPACTVASKTPNMSEQVVVNNGKLANVYVYLKSGLGEHSYPPPSEPVTITQRGCRYIPHVAAVLTGQTVKIVNDDPAMHNIHGAPTLPGNHEWNISQMPKGDPILRTFDAPEVMIPVKCNQHPWMKMYLSIADNPFFAVTPEDGSFTLKDLPPGDYTIAAVHEKYGEKDVQVHVGPKETKQISFGYSAQ